MKPETEAKKKEEKKEAEKVEKPAPLLFRGPWNRYRGDNHRGLRRPAGGYGETNNPT